jgi:hypothetical protein
MKPGMTVLTKTISNLTDRPTFWSVVNFRAERHEHVVVFRYQTTAGEVIKNLSVWCSVTSSA